MQEGQPLCRWPQSMQAGWIAIPMGPLLQLQQYHMVAAGILAICGKVGINR